MHKNHPSESDPGPPANGGGDDDMLDQIMSKELRNIPLPSGGLEAVLSAVQTARSAPPAAVEVRNVIPFTRRRWFRISAGAAACLAGGGFVFTQRARKFETSEGPADAATFIADAVAKATGTIMLAHKSKSWPELQTFLASRSAPSSALALGKLQSLGARGCQTYPWKSGTAGLTCYHQADSTLVHIFTIPRSLLGDSGTLPEIPVPLTTREDRACTWWGEPGQFCVMVAGKDHAPIDASLALLLA